MTKVFIVTGCTKGIGFEIAKQLLEDGHIVYGSGRSSLPVELQEIGEQNFGYLTLDHSVEGTGILLKNACIEKYGRIDGIVLNAGVIYPIAKIETVKLSDFKNLMQINLYSAIELIQASLPSLRETQGKCIFVSSGAAKEGYSGWGAYCISKCSMNSLNETLAKGRTFNHGS